MWGQNLIIRIKVKPHTVRSKSATNKKSNLLVKRTDPKLIS